MLSQKRPSSVHEYSANKKLKGVLKNVNQPKPQTQYNLPTDFFDKAPLQRNVSDGTVKNVIKVSKNDSFSEDTHNTKVEVEKEKEKENFPNSFPKREQRSNFFIILVSRRPRDPTRIGHRLILHLGNIRTRTLLRSSV